MKISIYVVRHGQTYSNVHGILQGHEDSPLTPVGRQCSTQTGNALKHIKFHKIYSSDSGRVKETLRHTGIRSDKTCIDERLRERNWGPYTGIPWREYKRLGYSIEEHPPGVETNEEMKQRWLNFFEENILREACNPTENTILIVTHGGMVRIIAKYFANFTTSTHVNINHASISNNCISVFELEIQEKVIVNCDIHQVYDCKHLQNITKI